MLDQAKIFLRNHGSNIIPETFSSYCTLRNKLTKAINYEFLDQNYKDWNQSKSFQPISREHYPFHGEHDQITLSPQLFHVCFICLPLAAPPHRTTEMLDIEIVFLRLPFRTDKSFH